MASAAQLALVLKASGQSDVQRAFNQVTKSITNIGSAVKAPINAVGSLVDALGRIGLAAQGIQSIASAAAGLGQSLGVGLASQMENVRAQLIAFTKDGAATDAILKQIRTEADKTPFSFQNMAQATVMLQPAAKASGQELMTLIRQAEILAALNPAQGLEGAAFSLREALSGDFISVMERFNIPRNLINQLKAEGVPAMEIVGRALQEMGADYSLVSNLAATTTGRFSTFKDAVDGIKIVAGQPILEALGEQLDRLSKFIEENKEMLTAFAQTIGNLVARVIRAASDLAERAVPLFLRLAAVVEKVFLGDMHGAFDNFRGLMTEIGANIVTKLQEWGTAFVEWVAPLIGPLLEALGNLALDVLVWLADQIPSLVAGMAEWGTVLVTWVDEVNGPLLTKLDEFGRTVFDWISDNSGSLGDEFMSWLNTAINWVVGASVQIVPNLLTLLTNVLRFISDKGPELTYKFLSEWLPAAIGWVAKTAIDILPELAKLLLTITVWIVGTAVPEILNFAFKMGNAIVSGMVKGLFNLGAMLVETIVNQLRKIKIDLGPFHLSAEGFRIDAPPAIVIETIQRTVRQVQEVVPGFAEGVQNFAGGLAVVGEQGPEVVRLPRGTDVIPNRTFGELMSGPIQQRAQLRSGVDDNRPVIIQIDGQPIYRATWGWLKRNGLTGANLGLS